MGNEAEKISTHRRQKQRRLGGEGDDVSYPATLVPRMYYLKLPTTSVTWVRLSNSSPWWVKPKMHAARSHSPHNALHYPSLSLSDRVC